MITPAIADAAVTGVTLSRYGRSASVSHAALDLGRNPAASARGKAEIAVHVPCATPRYRMHGYTLWPESRSGRGNSVRLLERQQTADSHVAATRLEPAGAHGGEQLLTDRERLIVAR